MSKTKGIGIDLLTPDSSDLTMTPVSDTTLPTSAISQATRRAIIVEKSYGDSDEIIALRYDIRPSQVAKVWRNFVDSTVDVRRLGDENPEIFKSKIRKKAVNAIENGLDCDRDPYRQANVGIQVMKGIGEFKSDDDRGSRINILIGSVPNEWKDRYISISPVSPKLLTSGVEADSQAEKGENHHGLEENKEHNGR